MTTPDLTSGKLSGLRVLYAEDNPVVVTGRYLKYDGAEVHRCESVQDVAEALIAGMEFDFVLMDGGLFWGDLPSEELTTKLQEKFPELSGFPETMKMARYVEKHPDRAFERGPWLVQVMHHAGITRHCLVCLTSGEPGNLADRVERNFGDLKRIGVREIIDGLSEAREYAALALAEKLTRGEGAADRAKHAAAMRQAAANVRGS